MSRKANLVSKKQTPFMRSAQGYGHADCVPYDTVRCFFQAVCRFMPLCSTLQVAQLMPRSHPGLMY